MPGGFDSYLFRHFVVLKSGFLPSMIFGSWAPGTLQSYKVKPMSGADMSHFTYADSPYPVRQGLKDAHRNYWQALASPGTWFNGAERVAIAAEVRNALDCPFCAERKTALSPYAVKGEHRSGTQLDPRVVDAVHRVITDQSRITQAYIDDNAAAGFTRRTVRGIGRHSCHGAEHRRV